MIYRRITAEILENISLFPIVALLGPRQVGKTTLAREITSMVDQDCLYLDLERDSHLNRLSEPELYLGQQTGRLVIIDEVQRRPDLFPLLRSLVDERRSQGIRAGQFLLLGSASRDLLQRSSETLAGRIAYLTLAPFSYTELRPRSIPMDQLWLRGGFPDSALARTDRASWSWRGHFISTYLERDLPQLGLRLPAELVRRLWSMLAHGQGNILNLSRLAASLGVDGKTVRRYLDILTDLFMVRQLPPWSGSSSKRLVKSPKVYVRDTGLVHRLARIPDLDTLLGHPLCGPSWEGFVIESALALLPSTWTASYFRTGAGAEIDLILEGPRQQTWAVEVKRTLSPRVTRGFHLGADDVGATRRLIVIPEGAAYPLAGETTVISLADFLELLEQIGLPPE